MDRTAVGFRRGTAKFTLSFFLLNKLEMFPPPCLTKPERDCLLANSLSTGDVPIPFLSPFLKPFPIPELCVLIPSTNPTFYFII